MNESPSKSDLGERTLRFAEDVLTYCASLPKGPEIRVVKNQLLRSATSVGANYRSARRARSRRDFLAKLSVVEEEADECVYWLRLLGGFLPDQDSETLRRLTDEANQLVAIVVASKKTARARGL